MSHNAITSTPAPTPAQARNSAEFRPEGSSYFMRAFTDNYTSGQSTGFGTLRASAREKHGAVMDLTTLVSGHLRYLGLGSPLIGNLNFNRTTGAGLALGQGTAASPTI